VSIDKLITHFNSFIPLKEEEKNDLSNRVIEKKIKRRQFVLQESDVCKHYTFVVSGLLKMYAVDEVGAEHNIQFASECEWIMDVSSFHFEKESRLYIEAIEPSVILQIKKADLIHLFGNYTKFNKIFRVIMENKFMEMQNRVLQNISSTAEQRYIAFLEQHSKLSNRLANTQIASYLGITKETLSRIRSQARAK